MGLYPSSDYARGTKWLVPFEDHEIAVCPGSTKSNPSQGVVRISHWTARGRMVSIPDQQIYPARRTGRLRIIDANGVIATLQAEDGALLYFDAAGRTFVDGPQVEGTPAPR